MCRNCIGNEMCERCIEEMTELKYEISDTVRMINNLEEQIRYYREVLETKLKQYRVFWRVHDSVRLPRRASLDQMICILRDGSQATHPDFQLQTRRDYVCILKVYRFDGDRASLKVERLFVHRHVLGPKLLLCTVHDMKLPVLIVPGKSVMLQRYMICDSVDNVLVAEPILDEHYRLEATIIGDYGLGGEYLAWLRTVGESHNMQSLYSFLKCRGG